MKKPNEDIYKKLPIFVVVGINSDKPIAIMDTFLDEKNAEEYLNRKRNGEKFGDARVFETYMMHSYHLADWKIKDKDITKGYDLILKGQFVTIDLVGKIVAKTVRKYFGKLMNSGELQLKPSYIRTSLGKTTLKFSIGSDITIDIQDIVADIICPENEDE